MKYLIIEDEKIAVERLKKLITKLRPDYQFLGSADTISKSVSLLRYVKDADVIFLDIQLSDGLSFEIFEHIEFDTPIIFTTAYDHYAIKAFKLNSVDYLLKPIDLSELQSAIEKFEKHYEPKSLVVTNQSIIKNLIESFHRKQHKERFVIKVGEHLKHVETADVHTFYSEDKATYLQTKDGKRYIIDFSLDKVEEIVDPGDFFRISRKYIVNLKGIRDIIQFTNSRLKLLIHNHESEQVIVARERVNQFKEWLDR